MKKLIVTIAIVLGMGLTSFAQGEYYGSVNPTEDNGFFNLGKGFFNNGDDMPLLPEISEYDEEDLAFSNYSQNNGENGLFGMGALYDRGNRDGGLVLPNMHNLTDDQEGDSGPLGSGIAVLMGLGAAYLVGKRRKED